jgi:hypothetical protein
MKATQAISFSWILDRNRDLLYYIGSALVGWLYAGLILLAIYRLDNPLTDALAVFSIAGFEVQLTLTILVIASWAFLLDAPHIWATLARTMLDPDEWRTRRTVLMRSWLWFLVGPAAILLPYPIAIVARRFGIHVEPTMLSVGAIVFFVLFRLWAYYHVVRQHWGFFSLYKRKAVDYEAYPERLDWWFFHLTLWVPLILFLTSDWYVNLEGYPDLGFRTPIIGDLSLASVIRPLAWSSYVLIIILYAVHNINLARSGRAVNGSKLVYMMLIIPLHFVAFSHPIMVFFAVPLVTVGHNIQYHCIVYSYGRNKYWAYRQGGFVWAKAAFRSFGTYAVLGLVFTFLCYRGPWIEWLKGFTGIRFDEVVMNSIGMMAGIANPAGLGLGEQIVAAVFVGWAMQHYYLDSKIWRVSRNKDVQKHLNV